MTNKPVTDKQNHGVSSLRNSRNVLVGDLQRIVAIQHPPLTPTKPDNQLFAAALATTNSGNLPDSDLPIRK
jgi:hypothetical protein